MRSYIRNRRATRTTLQRNEVVLSRILYGGNGVKALKGGVGESSNVITREVLALHQELRLNSLRQEVAVEVGGFFVMLEASGDACGQLADVKRPRLPIAG